MKRFSFSFFYNPNRTYIYISVNKNEGIPPKKRTWKNYKKRAYHVRHHKPSIFLWTKTGRDFNHFKKIRNCQGSPALPDFVLFNSSIINELVVKQAWRYFFAEREIKNTNQNQEEKIIKKTKKKQRKLFVKEDGVRYGWGWSWNN